MWDNIPVGRAVSIYTFTKEEIHYQGYTLKPDFRSIRSSSNVFPYSIVDDSTIEYVEQNRGVKQYKNPIMRLCDDNMTLVKNTYYYPGHWKVEAGEANVGDVELVITYYPYSAELRDMDYTKDLHLEGTTWVLAFQEENPGGSYYYQTNPRVTIAFAENTFVQTGFYETPEGTYTLTPKYILLDMYYPTGFGSQNAVAVVQGDKMIISPTSQKSIATNCYIKATDIFDY
jgi:hypothetical protein